MQVEKDTLNSLVSKWGILINELIIVTDPKNQGSKDIGMEFRSIEKLKEDEQELVKMADAEISRFLKEHIAYDNKQIATFRQLIKFYKEAKIRQGDKTENPIFVKIEDILVGLLRQKFENGNVKIAADGKQKEMAKMHNTLGKLKNSAFTKAYVDKDHN